MIKFQMILRVIYGIYFATEIYPKVFSFRVHNQKYFLYTFLQVKVNKLFSKLACINLSVI